MLAAIIDPVKEILIVEDDVLIRDLILEYLEMEGYRVAVASNGQEALDILHNKKACPSLILLDIMMPVMDGWQFRNLQSRDADISDIPVVVITADGNAEDKAAQMNAQGWIRKPINLAELSETIEECL